MARKRVTKSKGTPNFKWIPAAFGPKGALHKALKVPMGQRLPEAKLRAAAKKPGVTGDRARLALLTRTYNHKRKRK